MLKKLVLLVFFMLLPAISIAANVHVEWTMADPVASDIAGYRFYVDMVEIADIPGGMLRETDFSYDPAGPRISFTMTAYDIEGNESGHSEAVSVNPLPGTPLSVTFSGI